MEIFPIFPPALNFLVCPLSTSSTPTALFPSRRILVTSTLVSVLRFYVGNNIKSKSEHFRQEIRSKIYDSFNG